MTPTSIKRIRQGDPGVSDRLQKPGMKDVLADFLTGWLFFFVLFSRRRSEGIRNHPDWQRLSAEQFW
jgi:hypothetical protein